jgi:cytidylate kinase
MEKKIIIAIDGPSGVGKSSVAREVARCLGYLYIDTGAMYRAVGLKSRRQDPSLQREHQIVENAAQAHIVLQADSGGMRVLLDGEDVTQAIRSDEISQAASIVSKISGVRRLLVRAQQAMGTQGGVVMEGRDIGSQVFPQAELKIYLDADDETRARRRLEENERRGIALSFEDTLAQLKERDCRDSQRGDSPLLQTEDAIRVDTSRLSLDEVIEVIVNLAMARLSQ